MFETIDVRFDKYGSDGNIILDQLNKIEKTSHTYETDVIAWMMRLVSNTEIEFKDKMFALCSVSTKAIEDELFK